MDYVTLIFVVWFGALALAFLIGHLRWRLIRAWYPHRQLLDYRRIQTLEADIWGEAYHLPEGTCKLDGFQVTPAMRIDGRYSQDTQTEYSRIMRKTRPATPPPAPVDRRGITVELSLWQQAKKEADLAVERKKRREYMERRSRIERQEWTEAAEAVKNKREYVYKDVELRGPDGEVTMARVPVVKDHVRDAEYPPLP